MIVSVMMSITVVASGSFQSVVVPVSAADPNVVYKDGWYYYCWADGVNRIFVSKAKSLQDISATTIKETVWKSPAGEAYSKGLWAPELQYIQGKWYIYFAADDGDNANHRMYALEGNSQDPLGSYEFKGKVAPITDRWAIDGVAFEYDNKLYFTWSGWEDLTNGQQNTYLAEMTNPWTISGDRVKISEPTYSWEQNGMALQEGQEVLIKNNKVNLIYSASGSWTEDYCLGLLTFSGGDILDPVNWLKNSQPVFSKTTGAYGVGHCSFVQSPDGTEDWMVFHAMEKADGGWSGRHVRTQPFSWNNDEPVFGTPVTSYTYQDLPSGTQSNTIRYEAEDGLVNNASVRSQSNASADKVVGYIDYADSYVELSVNVTQMGLYPVEICYANGMGSNSSHMLSVNNGQATEVIYESHGWDVWTKTLAYVVLYPGNNVIRLTKGNNYAELDYIDIRLGGYAHEAEAATISNATVRNQGNASAGKVVGGIDYNDSYVEFDVHVNTSGGYLLTPIYANGMSSDSLHKVYVNNVEVGSANYPNHGWDVWSTAYVFVNLNAGNNTIRLQKGDQYAELDYLRIGRSFSVEEAEMQLINQAQVVASPTALEGKKVGYIDYANSYVEFEVYVPSTGDYDLQIWYSNGTGSLSSHNVSVNGGSFFTVAYESHGWDVWYDSIFTVALNKGRNTVRFTKGLGAAELDSLNIRPH